MENPGNLAAKMAGFAAELQRLDAYISERRNAYRFEFVDLSAVLLSAGQTVHALAAAAEDIQRDALSSRTAAPAP